MSEFSKPKNHTLLQTFEWHTPSQGTHYASLSHLLPKFSELGITSILLPPGCKPNNPKGNGYDAYDLWDLGEFEQKGSRSTKWGDKNQLDALIQIARDHDIDVIWDAVLNHKQGGDRLQNDVWAVEVDKEDRRYEICPPKQIQAWLQYDFPGRQLEGEMQYSQMKWRAEHFSGTDWDQSRRKNAIYKLINDPSTQPPFEQPRKSASKPIAPPRSRLSMLKRRFSGRSEMTQTAPSKPARRPGKGWAEDVDSENGNSDFLLFSDIDHTHPEVREDMLNWGEWIVRDVGVQGFRLDAARHFSYNFTKEWILRVTQAAKRKESAKDVFVAGEIWSGEVHKVLKWLDVVQSPNGPQVYAYDIPLLYNFSRISEDVRTKSKNTDLRTIIRDSLLQHRPEAAVTMVTNHDTQPGQTCYTPMDRQLKSLFYAFILLRKEGYPCVFWGDLFGTHGPQAEEPACLVPDEDAKGGKRSLLPYLVRCRKLFAYGEQRDYWDSATCIGWTRAGDEQRPGCTVVLNVSPTRAVKKMHIGGQGEIWVDALGQIAEEVKVDAKGFGVFPCKDTSVSVFVRKDVLSRIGSPDDLDISAFQP